MDPDRGYPVSAEAIEPSVLFGFDSDVMRGVLRESVDTCFRVLASLSYRLRQRVDEIEKPDPAPRGLAPGGVPGRAGAHRDDRGAPVSGNPPGRAEERHRLAPRHPARDVLAGRGAVIAMHTPSQVQRRRSVRPSPSDRPVARQYAYSTAASASERNVATVSPLVPPS